MTRRDVTEAEVQAKLAVMRAGQPWTGLGAVATVAAALLLILTRDVSEETVSKTAVYIGSLVLFAAGVVLQVVGHRRRKAFTEQAREPR